MFWYVLMLSDLKSSGMQPKTGRRINCCRLWHPEIFGSLIYCLLTMRQRQSNEQRSSSGAHQKRVIQMIIQIVIPVLGIFCQKEHHWYPIFCLTSPMFMFFFNCWQPSISASWAAQSCPRYYAGPFVSLAEASQSWKAGQKLGGDASTHVLKQEERTFNQISCNTVSRSRTLISKNATILLLCQTFRDQQRFRCPVGLQTMDQQNRTGHACRGA